MPCDPYRTGESVTAHRAGRAVLAESVNAYERWVQWLTEFALMLAAEAGSEPLRALARTWADGTRDATAIHLSALRWLYDL